MGISLSSNMQGSHSQPFIQIDPTQNGQLIEQHQNFKVFQNSKGHQFQKYLISKQFQQQKKTSKGYPSSNQKKSFQQNYNYRLTHRSKDLVQLLYAAPKYSSFACHLDSKSQYEVVTERIKHRLSQLYNISFENALTILKVSLKGFKNLYTYNGILWIKDTMIGINSYDQVKVWLNSNFGLNDIQPLPLSLTNLTPQLQQDIIVNNLIDMISSKTFPSYQWKQFMKLRIQAVSNQNSHKNKISNDQNMVNQNNNERMTFSLAFDLVFSIASKFNVTLLPDTNRVYDLFSQRTYSLNNVNKNVFLDSQQQKNKYLNNSSSNLSFLDHKIDNKVGNNNNGNIQVNNYENNYGNNSLNTYGNTYGNNLNKKFRRQQQLYRQTILQRERSNKNFKNPFNIQNKIIKNHLFQPQIKPYIEGSYFNNANQQRSHSNTYPPHKYINKQGIRHEVVSPIMFVNQQYLQKNQIKNKEQPNLINSNKYKAEPINNSNQIRQPIQIGESTQLQITENKYPNQNLFTNQSNYQSAQNQIQKNLPVNPFKILRNNIAHDSNILNGNIQFNSNQINSNLPLYTPSIYQIYDSNHTGRSISQSKIQSYPIKHSHSVQPRRNPVIRFNNKPVQTISISNETVLPQQTKQIEKSSKIQQQNVPQQVNFSLTNQIQLNQQNQQQQQCLQNQKNPPTNPSQQQIKIIMQNISDSSIQQSLIKQNKQQKISKHQNLSKNKLTVTSYNQEQTHQMPFHIMINHCPTPESSFVLDSQSESQIDFDRQSSIENKQIKQNSISKQSNQQIFQRQSNNQVLSKNQNQTFKTQSDKWKSTVKDKESHLIETISQRNQSSPFKQKTSQKSSQKISSLIKNAKAFADQNQKIQASILSNQNKPNEQIYNFKLKQNEVLDDKNLKNIYQGNNYIHHNNMTMSERNAFLPYFQKQGLQMTKINSKDSKINRQLSYHQSRHSQSQSQSQTIVNKLNQWQNRPSNQEDSHIESRFNQNQCDLLNQKYENLNKDQQTELPSLFKRIQLNQQSSNLKTVNSLTSAFSIKKQQNLINRETLISKNTSPKQITYKQLRKLLRSTTTNAQSNDDSYFQQ